MGNGRLNHTKSRSSQEELKDGPIADELPPRIQPGKYEAICYEAKLGTSWGRAPRMFLRFRIYGGRCDGTELFMACTCNLTSKKMSHRHKYYQQWTIANGSPPRKNQRLSPKVFLNRMFQVLVRDTSRRFPNKEPYPDCLQYSVIETLIEPMTGGSNG